MQPEPPAPPPADGQAQGAAELDRLRGTTDREVGQASFRLAGLTVEEEESRKRTHRDRRRGVWAEVEGWSIRATGVLGIILGLCFAALVLAILVRYLGITFKDPEKVEELVKNAVWAALIAGATSWGTSLLKRGD